MTNEPVIHESGECMGSFVIRHSSFVDVDDEGRGKSVEECG
jgi:hypothetical protein